MKPMRVAGLLAVAAVGLMMTGGSDLHAALGVLQEMEASRPVPSRNVLAAPRPDFCTGGGRPVARAQGGMKLVGPIEGRGDSQDGPMGPRRVQAISAQVSRAPLPFRDVSGAGILPPLADDLCRPPAPASRPH